MAIESRMKDIGDALIAWYAARVTSLNLVSFDWAKGMKAQPSYPCNPRTQCPRAFLRVYRGDHLHADTLGCDGAKFIYACSIWLQLRQTPGQDHQEIMVAALDVFNTAIIQAKFDLQSLPVTGLIKLDVLPNQAVVYDELDHPLLDPALRVSVGEINLTLDGEISEA